MYEHLFNAFSKKSVKTMFFITILRVSSNQSEMQTRQVTKRSTKIYCSICSSTHAWGPFSRRGV